MTIRRFRAAAYLRVSTQKQATKDLSLPSQLRDIQQYAQTYGFTIVKTYSDEGVSGTHQYRPKFQQMLADARAGKFDVIIAWNIARFGRGMLDRATKRELRDMGIAIRYVTDNIADDDESYFTEGILELMAQRQIDELRKSVRRGQVEAVRQGRHGVPGVPPTGYKAVYEQFEGDSRPRRTLKIDTATAFYVREAFKRYAAGKESIRSLGLWLTEQGVPTYAVRKGKAARGSTHGVWLHQTVRKMLQNRTYCGDLVYGRRTTSMRVKGKRRDRYTDPNTWTIYENFHEAIVSRELFEAVQKRLSENRQTKPVALHHDNFLRNVGRCAGCGGGLTFESNGKAYARYYYGCRNLRRLKVGTERCRGFVPAFVILEHLVAYLKETYGAACTAQFLRKANAFNKKALESTSPELEALRAQLSDINSKIANVLVAIEAGSGNIKSLVARLEEHEQQRHIIEERVKQASKEDEKVREPIDLERFEANIEELKALVRRGRTKALAKLIPELLRHIIVDLSAWARHKDTAAREQLLNIAPRYDLEGLRGSGPVRSLAFFLRLDGIATRYCGTAAQKPKRSSVAAVGGARNNRARSR